MAKPIENNQERKVSMTSSVPIWVTNIYSANPDVDKNILLINSAKNLALERKQYNLLPDTHSYEVGDLKKRGLKMLSCRTPTDYTTKALMDSNGCVIKTIRVLEPKTLIGDPSKIKKLLEFAGLCDQEDIPFAYDNLKLTGDFENYEPYADPSRWSWIEENRLCFDSKDFYETYDSPEAVARQKRISEENEVRLNNQRTQQYAQDKRRYDESQRLQREFFLKMYDDQVKAGTIITQADHDRVQAEDTRKALEEARAKEKLNIQEREASPDNSEVSGASSSKSKNEKT